MKKVTPIQKTTLKITILHLAIVYLITGLFCFATNPVNKIFFFKNNPTLGLPDSIEGDSILDYGDTVETFITGLDSIIILADNLPESEEIDLRIIDATDIQVTLTNDKYTVNQRNFGVNMEGFFDKYNGAAADEALYTGWSIQNPYELLIQLQPKVLRNPSGATSKFQHPFGSSTSSDFLDVYNSIVDASEIKNGTKNGGYGYEIEEIIRYYDKTDNAMNAPGFLELIDEMEPLGVVPSGWIATPDMADFNSFYKLWKKQISYDPADYLGIWEEPLYLNDFVELVKQIETRNGYTVDVICALNILSEPAQNVTNMIDYLRSSALNHNYSVNVVGVELGNECYFEFFNRAMGFGCYKQDVDATHPIAVDNSAFDHYWAYVNGADDYDAYFSLPGGYATDFVLSDVLDPVNMAGHHNYIDAIRSNAAYNNIKIGIPVENPSNSSGAFVTPQIEYDEILGGTDCNTWNSEVVERYGETKYGKYVINAVIPHLYYTSNNPANPSDNKNWGEIPIGNYNYISPSEDITFYPACLDNNLATTAHDNFNSFYDFTTYDDRLSCAFDGILDHSLNGSFKKFVKSRQRESMLELATELALDGSSPYPKECWITEWNIKNSLRENPDDAEMNAQYFRTGVYFNSFVHAYLMQEEFLNNIKFNYTAGFATQFLKIATVQNFIDGSESDLVKISTRKDLFALGLTTDCSEPFKPFLPRTTYFSYSLLNSIHIQNLKYLKTTQIIYHTNNNQPITAFIDYSHGTATSRDIYFYFTNVKDEPQTYIIKPGTLTTGSFAGKHGVIHCLSTQQLYSRSGSGNLFDINDAYDLCDIYANWYEVNSLDDIYTDYDECPELPADAMCVKVPAHSIGYFVINYDPSLREGDLTDTYQIFPNPTSKSFTIQQIEGETMESNNYDVSIYNMYGNLVQVVNVQNGEPVNIALLPVGLYQIIFKTSEGKLYADFIVKMK